MTSHFPQYVDTRTGTPGNLVGYDGRDYLLKPPGGGREWICPVRYGRQVPEVAPTEEADCPAQSSAGAPDAGQPRELPPVGG